MKLTLLAVVATLTLAGCASTKTADVEPGQVTAITAQKLSTSFKRQGIKLEWECSWGFSGLIGKCSSGEIKAVEVTGYAPSYGNSEVSRETAFIAAHDVAADKLSRFIKQDISSSRVMHTLTRNVEKATDRIKTKISVGEEVAMSDDEASKDTTHAIRENTNDTVRTITENIRSNAQMILRGVRTVDESIVDRQTVAVTIRWDKDSEKATKYLSKHLGN